MTSSGSRRAARLLLVPRTLITFSVIASLGVTSHAEAQASAAVKKRAAKPVSAVAKPSVPADSTAVERAFLEADEKFYADRLLQQRAEYLKRSAWANLGDRCNPGDLRIFPRATTAEQQEELQHLVERMESTVIARGVGAKLDTPDAALLLRTIVGWEAGISRPRWDANEKTPRMAIAAGLTGEVPDPRSAKCLASPVASDTVTFVLPGFQTMVFPKAPTPRVKAYFGAQAQQHARDEFFTTVGRNSPDAELAYILVAPVVIWRDWALLAVDRPREKGGVEIGAASNGGATYLLHRVAGEWRLMSIVRSWGS